MVGVFVFVLGCSVVTGNGATLTVQQGSFHYPETVFERRSPARLYRSSVFEHWELSTPASAKPESGQRCRTFEGQVCEFPQARVAQVAKREPMTRTAAVAVSTLILGALWGAQLTVARPGRSRRRV